VSVTSGDSIVHQIVFSAMGMLHETALYKFAIDTGIALVVRGSQKVI